MYGGMGEESDYEQEDEFGMEEYLMDDSLDAVSRLEKYHTSDFALQRLVLVRDLAETARACGPAETKSRILPLLPTLTKDTEPAVRSSFVDNLYDLADFLIGADGDGYQQLLDCFLPAMLTLVVDKNAQVGIAAVNGVVKLATLVKDEDVHVRLIEPVLKLATNERMEDDRMVAAQLFNTLSERLGKEKCEESILDAAAKLADDQRFSVRKVLASSLDKLIVVVGEQVATEKVLPIFYKLCADSTWEVRKACVGHCIELAQVLPAETRRGPLLEQYMKFREDSRWVKVAANQSFGQFIRTFDKADVTAEMVSTFCSLAPAGDQADPAADFSEACAFAFPAVVEVLGPDRWGELEGAYLRLIQNPQWKVRRTLAFSLHAIAGVVGPEITDRVLSQAYDLFIRDVDEVQVGVMTHAAAFVGCVPDASRVKLVQPLCTLLLETESWRLRAVMAKQFGAIASLVSPEFVKDVLQDSLKRLCDDNVADVRAAANPACAKVLKRMSEGPGAKGSKLHGWVMELLGDGIDEPHYVRRQIFAEIAGFCVGEGVLVDEMQKELEKLAGDPCANVRIALAKVLAEVKKAGCSSVDDLIGRLKKDSDGDVSGYASA